jgi:hypothetical protein
MSPPVTLPAATIQDDFATVLSEVHTGLIPSENVWLSCYKDGELSVHGKIAISLHERDRDRVELVGTGGVELTRTSQVRASISWRGKNIFSSFRTWPFLSPPLVQVRRPLLKSRNRRGGFRLSDGGLRGSSTLG